VSEEQLERVSSTYEEVRAARRRAEKEDPEKFIKICVLHHHPVAYETVPTTTYDKVVRLITKDEDSFSRLENAHGLLTWCGDRDVSLILHGHKHVAHQVRVMVEASDKSRKVIHVVGCGSTTGVDNSPLSYVIISVDPSKKLWGINFYNDPSSSGAGFRSQEIAIGNRSMEAAW
jgi:3',5'-cyclic AMP phosphodiesterase CpdA